MTPKDLKSSWFLKVRRHNDFKYMNLVGDFSVWSDGKFCVSARAGHSIQSDMSYRQDTVLPKGRPCRLWTPAFTGSCTGGEFLVSRSGLNCLFFLGFQAVSNLNL